MLSGRPDIRKNAQRRGQIYCNSVIGHGKNQIYINFERNTTTSRRYNFDVIPTALYSVRDNCNANVRLIKIQKHIENGPCLRVRAVTHTTSDYVGFDSISHNRPSRRPMRMQMFPGIGNQALTVRHTALVTNTNKRDVVWTPIRCIS